MEHLDLRETDSYIKLPTTFYPKDDSKGGPFELNVYFGNEHDPTYTGPAELSEIASHIYKSKGKSGTNEEYVFSLADAMREICPHVPDDHLYSLEKEVKLLCEQEQDSGKKLY